MYLTLALYPVPLVRVSVLLLIPFCVDRYSYNLERFLLLYFSISKMF